MLIRSVLVVGALAVSRPVVPSHPPLQLPSAAWGDHGHRLVARAAVRALPNQMPAFFREAGEQLVYLNPEPDRWRTRTERDLDPALDNGSAPDHFIDLELVPPGALAAPDRYQFLMRLVEAGERAPARVGFLPFRITELTQRLRESFRRWRAAGSDEERRFIEQRILNDAGILGHYVADGANPHHTTIHYNGWSGPNPNGYPTDRQTHARFESIFVGARLRDADVQPLVRRDPRAVLPLRDGVLGYLGETHALVERLYQLDKAIPFADTTSAPSHVAFAAERLAAGAVMLRDLWWTAWITSGWSAAPASR